MSAIRLPSTTARIRDLSIIVLATIVAVRLLVPDLLARAQDNDAVEPRAALPSSFTYQGRLDIDGLPATGSYDFEFALFDVEAGGTALATLPPLTGVPVNNGQFTVQLAFPGAQFQGEQRWLNVRVRPNASTPFSDLARQELTATPYALYAKSVAMAGTGSATTAARSDHNHYGSIFTGSTNSYGLTVDNETANGTGLRVEGDLVGILGNQVLNSLGGSGVMGTAKNGAGVTGVATTGTGVQGQGSVGLFGTSDFLFGLGVWGVAQGNEGMGVQGVGGRYGVRGIGGVVGGSGVHGIAAQVSECQGLGANFPDLYCYGVTGVATDVPGTGGVGVKGVGNNTGVWAQGGAIGLYATGTQDAGYFNGDLTVTGSFPTPSDARLKRDVSDLTYGLDQVLALRPKSYAYTNSDGEIRLGFIAQDVQAIIPELIGTDALNGDMLTMSYIELIPVLVRAIQEQQARIDALLAE